VAAVVVAAAVAEEEVATVAEVAELEAAVAKVLMSYIKIAVDSCSFDRVT
jgi:hypothetical protein